MDIPWGYLGAMSGEGYSGCEGSAKARIIRSPKLEELETGAQLNHE